MPLEFTPITTFLTRTIPHQAIIGEDLLDAQGLMLIVGPTGAGKTYFVQQLANELAGGGPWLGRFGVEKGVRVGLMQAELGEWRFQKRLEKVPKPHPFMFVATNYDVKLDEPKGVRELERAVAEMKTEVLIVDPLKPFFAGDENSSTDVNKLFSGVRALQAKHNFAVIFTHHERKTTIMSKPGKSEARGSGVLTDRPDTVLRLAEVKGERRLTFEKVRNAEDGEKLGPFTLVQDPATTLFSIVDDGGPLIPSSFVVNAVGNGTTLAELKREVAFALNVSEKAVERRVNVLIAQGALNKGIDPMDNRQRVVTVREV